MSRELPPCDAEGCSRDAPFCFPIRWFEEGEDGAVVMRAREVNLCETHDKKVHTTEGRILIRKKPEAEVGIEF